MPHELVLKNTDLIFNEVEPAIRDLWDDEWENRWWPKRLLQARPPVTVPA